MKTYLIIFVAICIMAGLVGYYRTIFPLTVVVDNPTSLAAFNEKNAQIKQLTDELKKTKDEFAFQMTFEDERCTCVPYQTRGYTGSQLSQDSICQYKGWK